MKYRIIHNVEINGKYYVARDAKGALLGTLVDAAEFSTAPPMREQDNENEPHLSEVHSLLATGHIEPE